MWLRLWGTKYSELSVFWYENVWVLLLKWWKWREVSTLGAGSLSSCPDHFFISMGSCYILKSVALSSMLAARPNSKKAHHHNFLTPRWKFWYRLRLPLVTSYGLTHMSRLNLSISKVKNFQPLTCCSGSVSVNMKPLLHKSVSIHSMSPRHPTVSLGLPLSELFWSSEEREKGKISAKTI